MWKAKYDFIRTQWMQQGRIRGEGRSKIQRLLSKARRINGFKLE